MASTRNNLHEQTEEFQGVFEEDVVVNKTNKKKIGVVLKAYKTDQFDDSDASYSDEDEKLDKGKVLVGWYSWDSKWTNEDSSIVEEKTVELIDRSVLPGDVVRWVDRQKKGIQKGCVCNTNVFVDLSIIGTNHILKNINAKKLLPFTKFSPDAIIVKGPWLGVIMGNSVELILRMKNNAKCVVSGKAVEGIIDITDQRDEDSTFYNGDFYPGQQVQGHARLFKEAKWIVGPRPILNNNTRVKAIVEDVKLIDIDVDWRISGYNGKDTELFIQPSPTVKYADLTGDDVFVPQHFADASIQIGDKTFYVLTDDDLVQCNIVTNPPGESREKQLNKEANANKDSSTPSKQQFSDDEDCDDDNNMESDGSVAGSTQQSHQQRQQSLTSGAASNLNRRAATRPRRKRHSHIMTKKRKRYRPPVDMVSGEKVCVEVCMTRTIASVEWQDGSMESGILSNQLFPVLHVDAHEFFPGDFVIDKRDNNDADDDNKFGVIQKVAFDSRLCNVCWLSHQGDGTVQSGVLEEDISVYEIEDHKDFHFTVSDIVVRLDYKGPTQQNENTNTTLAPVGQVLQVCANGLVKVLWVDGSRSSVMAFQLYPINVKDENESEFDENDTAADGDEWETTSENSDLNLDMNYQEQLDPLEDVITRSLSALNPSNSAPSMPQDTTYSTPANNNAPQEHVIGLDRRTALFINALDQRFNTSIGGNAGNTEEKEADGQFQAGHEQSTKKSNKNDTLEKQGDINESFVYKDNAPSSHQFFTIPSEPSNARSFISALMRDTRLLSSHLPPGIQVFAFSDRRDLFSALITGPSGTPYEDGLFCFDLQLPNDYPVSPPEVHYHSYCSQRLNPNLYEEGKVCVSLLGTWMGKGNETWTKNSTIHQLLVSIQSLILNEEPYYNEAGYENQRGSAEGLENSRNYNEMVVIKTLQSINKMINRPPDIFKEEIIAHFKQRLPILIARYEEWIHPKNAYSKPNTNKPQFPLYPISKGCCITVDRQLKLLKAILQKSPFLDR